MARVRCAICGRFVITSSNNYIFANGLHQHKKCPPKSNVLTEEELKDMRELTDAIQYLAIKYDRPLNWTHISAQIKKIKEQGYSYKDQTYALKYIYELDHQVFWGYGRTEKFMVHAMEHKKKQEEYELKKKEGQELKVKQNTIRVTSKNNSFLKL